MFGDPQEREGIFKVTDRGELRYKYRIKREYFLHSAREVADGAICDAVMAALSGYDSFFIYYSFSSEADTHALIDKLIAAGKKVYLPRVEGREMSPVLYDGNADKLVKNRYGIQEPVGERAKEDVDVTVAPLLAVNSKGYRLGYGGGYYDRFFASGKGGLRVGLGYFLQYTEEFEGSENDEPLDLFISERGIIRFGR